MAKSPAFRFYPGDFMASPDVQSMDLNEVGAYTLLLCIAWQQDQHGYLPDDENKLRRWARMSPEQWSISREMLLGKFPVIEPGLRGNLRMIREAEKQAEFSAKQSGNGRLGGRPKKGLGLEDKSMGLENKPKQKPNTPEQKPSVFVFVSDSDSEEVQEQLQEQIPSHAPKGARANKAPKEPDPRHTEFRDLFRGYFLHANKGISAEPWDAQEAAQLSRFLKKNPSFTTEQWRSLLWNRARSSVTHGENLSAWIGRALSWSSQPTDRFGNQLPGGNTHGNTYAKPTVAENIAAKQAFLDIRSARRLADEQNHSGRTLEAGDAGSEPRGAGDATGALFRIAR